MKEACSAQGVWKDLRKLQSENKEKNIGGEKNKEEDMGKEEKEESETGARRPIPTGGKQGRMAHIICKYSIAYTG